MYSKGNKRYRQLNTRKTETLIKSKIFPWNTSVYSTTSGMSKLVEKSRICQKNAKNLQKCLKNEL